MKFLCGTASQASGKLEHTVSHLEGAIPYALLFFAMDVVTFSPEAWDKSSTFNVGDFLEASNEEKEFVGAPSQGLNFKLSVV